MARIKGVDVPNNKRIEIALTYIYGIGRSLSNRILKDAGIDKNRKAGELSNEELVKIRDEVNKYVTEGDLRREVNMNIKTKMEIGSYQGNRHKRGGILFPASDRLRKKNLIYQKAQRDKENCSDNTEQDRKGVIVFSLLVSPQVCRGSVLLLPNLTALLPGRSRRNFVSRPVLMHNFCCVILTACRRRPSGISISPTGKLFSGARGVSKFCRSFFCTPAAVPEVPAIA